MKYINKGLAIYAVLGALKNSSISLDGRIATDLLNALESLPVLCDEKEEWTWTETKNDR